MAAMVDGHVKKDIGGRWIFCTGPRGTPSVIGFPISYNGHGLRSLALAYVGSNSFCLTRFIFRLGPYFQTIRHPEFRVLPCVN